MSRSNPAVTRRFRSLEILAWGCMVGAVSLACQSPSSRPAPAEPESSTAARYGKDEPWAIFKKALGIPPASASAPQAPVEPRYEPRPAPPSSTGARSRSGRSLGVMVTAGKLGYDESFLVAREAGSEFVERLLSWDEFESGSARSPKVDKKFLERHDKLYSSLGLKSILCVNPIDTNNLRLPKYLKDKPFDDPLVIERYKAFFDFVLSHVPRTEVLAVAVGNEVDAYLGEDPERWQQYQRFFRAVDHHIRTRLPGIPVGVIATMDGFLERPVASRQLLELNRYTDAVFVTYFPLEGGSTGRLRVAPPETVHRDFDRITSRFPGKQVHVTEIGYPSSEALGSSEALQAQFVRETFQAWDRHADQIASLQFVSLHDLGRSHLKELGKYYGAGDRSFLDFLGTLGLRTYEGREKPALQALRELARD